jgi:hypothetical protein
MDGEQLAEAIAANPQFVPGGMQAEAMSMLDHVVYEFYVTESNQVRRMAMVMEMFGMEVESTYDFLPLEPGYQVALPDPTTVQTIDITEFL